MQTLVRPCLPGQPMSDAEKQLIAKLDHIDSLHLLNHAAHTTFVLERDGYTSSDLETLHELDWNEDDGMMALGDATDQAARELALEVEYEARWSAGFNPEPQKIIATFCIGGPTVRLSTSIDHRGNCIAEETEGHFSWGVDSGTVDVPADYHDALRWFWGLVAC